MLDITFWGIGIDKIFMGLLGISAAVFFILNVRELIKSPELKYRSITAKLCTTFANLCNKYKKSSIVKKDFLLHTDKNCAVISHNVHSIIIEDTYLTNSSPYMKKSNYNKLS